MRTIWQVMAFITTTCALLFLGAACNDRPAAWELPPIADSPIRGRWVQLLSVERQGHHLELMAVIESDGKEFTLVGLSALGQRLLRITWSQGKVVQVTDPAITVPIDGAAILRDVVFAHWPVQALKTVFAGTGWQITITDRVRTLAWRGRPWMSVESHIGTSDAHAESLVVSHLVEGYQVRVTMLEQNEP